MTQMNISVKKKQMHRHREQTCGCQGGGGEGGKNWKFGISRCQLIYLRWINNKILLYTTGNYIQYLMINLREKNFSINYISRQNSSQVILLKYSPSSNPHCKYIKK